MEIPLITRMADFDAGVDISQTLFVPGVVAVSKWTPLLVLALAAAVAGLVTTVKLFAVRVRSGNPLLHSQELQFGYDDSDADTACSSDDDDGESDDEEEEEAEVVDDCRRRVEGDFRVRGSGDFVSDQWQSRKMWLRQSRGSGDVFPWPDLAGGKSVVRLWDDLNLGFELLDGHDSGAGKLISVHDTNEEQEMSSLLATPPVVVSAAGAESRSVEVKVWDRRVSCRVPAILAEWRAQYKEIVRRNVCGFEEIFIAGEVTVGDIRKANAALDNVTGWDADAVNLTDGLFDGLGVTRCCDAVRSHLLLGNGKWP